MIRILGLVDADYIHAIKWANYLAARGNALHLVSFSALSRNNRQDYHPSVTIDPWIIPTFHLKRFWITLRAARRLRAIARGWQPQIVHAHYLGHAAWIAALAGLRPLAVSVMGGGDVTGSTWLPSSTRERLLTPFTLRRTDLVLCWSRNLAATVAPLANPGANVQVVVGGVDSDLFRSSSEAAKHRRMLGFHSDEFVIFSPRLFRPLSNIDKIIRALPRIREVLPGARLLVLKHHAERYPGYEAAIDSLVEDLGVRSLVKFLPSIPNQEMPLYYGAADCTVSIPSTDGTPMTVVESAACGTPAIVLDLPDYDPTLFRDGQTVVRAPSSDPLALADAVVRLASDREAYETLRREGRAMALQHADYDSEMGRVEGFYEELLAGRR